MGHLGGPSLRPRRAASCGVPRKGIRHTMAGSMALRATLLMFVVGCSSLVFAQHDQRCSHMLNSHVLNWRNFGDYCYYAFDNNTYEAARDSCIWYYDAVLANIESQAEYDFLSDLLLNDPKCGGISWLGYVLSPGSGEVTPEADDIGVLSSFWGPSQPDLYPSEPTGSCAVLDATLGYIKDEKCTDNMNYVGGEFFCGPCKSLALPSATPEPEPVASMVGPALNTNAAGGSAAAGYNTVDECLAMCLGDDACFSVDFNNAARPWGGIRCWVHYSDVEANLKYSRNCDHYAKVIQ